MKWRSLIQISDSSSPWGQKLTSQKKKKKITLQSDKIIMLYAYQHIYSDFYEHKGCKGVPPVSMLYNNNTTCYQMILHKEHPAR